MGKTIVDLRKNIGATPKFDEFWEVILFRLLLGKIFISFMITAYFGLSQPRTQDILRLHRQHIPENALNALGSRL